MQISILGATTGSNEAVNGKCITPSKASINNPAV
jgi:hypothetical protein